MLRKMFLALLIILFMGITVNAYADAGNLFEGVTTKLGRGVVNTATGWIEIPSQIVKGHDQGFIDNNLLRPVGILQGVVSGVVHATGRTFSGIIDIATFWTADPSDLDNEGIGLTLDAEHSWEQGDPKSIGDPTLVEGAMKPIGRKLVRGMGDLLFGFVELPGQIVKGVGEGAFDAGIIKGVWYSVSREIDGICDIITFWMPVPGDNKALAYDEERPWTALHDAVSNIF